MWSSYKKVFVFRDCFAIEHIEGDVAAINKLLSLEQSDKSYGALITTDFLTVSTIVDGFEIDKREDDGTMDLNFYKEGKEVCGVSMDRFRYREIQLQFEIEEEVETGEFKIHNRNINAFNDYQV